MALFTNLELSAKAIGYLSTVSGVEYDRAHSFATAQVTAYTRHKYEAVITTASTVLKELGLELGLWHVVTEHFNEQTNPVVAQIWDRRDQAIEALKAIAKNEISADAASTEVAMQEIHFQSTVDYLGNPITVFDDYEVSTW